MSTVEKSTKNYNILVVGAGVAGPVLAHYLHRFGMKPVVVERAPQLRASGQNVDLRGEGKEVAWRMGLESKIREKHTQEQGVHVVNSAGQTLASFSSNSVGDKGFVAEIEILRGDLVNILYEHTRKDVEYIFGDHPTSIRDNGDHVQVEFASGNTRKFDLVIGADGIHSKTRRLVFEESSLISYMDMYTAYFTIPSTETDSNWSRWYNAPGGRAIILRPDNQGTTRALFIFRTNERGYENLDITAQKNLLQNLYADAGFEAPRILSQLQNADDFYFDTVGLVKMNRWSQGRVALLGDAAYSTSLGGAGTGLAFLGAYILAGELAHRQDYTEAFKQYETFMRPYVADAQQLSPGSISVAIPKTSIAIGLRNSLLSLVARPSIMGIIKRLISSQNTKEVLLPNYEATTTQ